MVPVHRRGIRHAELQVLPRQEPELAQEARCWVVCDEGPAGGRPVLLVTSEGILRNSFVLALAADRVQGGCH